MGPTRARPGQWLRFAFAILTVGSAATVAEGAARLVKDIAPGSAPNAVSYPEEFVSLDEIVLFTADEPERGRELWRTDGTPEGTGLVADIVPGERSSFPFGLVVVNDVAYFAASDEENGIELWRTDGTTAGTRLVADINPGGDGSRPRHLSVHNGLLYFSANDGTSGEELWRSDGTETGTRLVTDVAIGSFDGAPRELTSAAGLLFFVADDAFRGCELWSSDGSDSGTRLVRNIRPGGGCTVDSPPFGQVNTGPRGLVAAAGMLFFATEDGTLWRSDGTASGTTPVVNVLDGGCAADLYSCPPSEVTAFGDALLFQGFDASAGREPWISDGTPEGTFALADIAAGERGSNPRSFFVFGDAAYFTADDGAGRRVWRTDGTAEGTLPVTGPPDAGIEVDAWTAVDETLYFVAGGVKPGLWRSDGSETGTTLISSGGSTSRALAVAGRTLIFDRGEPWRSDGTAGGTELLKDIYRSPVSSIPTAAVDLDGALLFFASDPENGRELWRSDGSAAGTILVADIFPGTEGAGEYTLEIARLGDAVFFAADDGTHGTELWRSDGTPQGTALVADVAAGLDGGLGAAFEKSSPIQPAGTFLFFRATTPAQGEELWRSDGTREGTVLVRDIRPGAASSRPGNLTPLGATLYFTADDGTDGPRLWRSDGTEDGTVRVEANANEPADLAPAGTVLFFSARHPQRGREPWRTDGTAPGTLLVQDIAPGPDSSSPAEFTEVGGAVLFTADDVEHGRELWRSDGRAAGTVLVRDFAPGPAASGPRGLVSLGGRIYFFADAGPGDTPLWVSDGTEPGTVRFEKPPLDATAIRSVTAVGDRLLLRVADGAGGDALWTADGTSGRARLVPSLGDEGAVSLRLSDFEFVVSGDLVYFTAHDEIHGTELWAFPLRNLTTFCAGDCDGDGRVGIPELISGVAIELTRADLDTCENLDADLDESVALDELVTAVGNALQGCR